METGKGKPVYTCPRCSETYEGDIHACKEASQEVSARIELSNTEMATTPTLPGTVAAAKQAQQTVRHDSLIGETVAGRYKILRKMGEGGMGAVYEAQHNVIGKHFALKVLLDKYAQKHDVVARLQQEARLASSIGHPSIVDVNDFGETADGRSFVVMEFLDGESLAQLIQQKAPLPPERVLPIIRQAADALGAAHQKDILHRDVKPENVFITRRDGKDFVKVLDFGISKAMKKPEEEEDSPRLTQTGMVLGTPLYMSPEQARGESELDQRIDIYALGVIMYEALSGETPFRGTNYLGIINQVLTQQATPLRQLRPDLPLSEALERVVMKMMHKDRNRRYAQMTEVVADIDRLLAGDQNVGMPVMLPDESLRTRAVEPRERSTGFVAGGITLFVVVAAITAIVAAKRRSAVADIPSVPVVMSAAPDAAPAGPRVIEVRIEANTPCKVYNGEKEIARSGDPLPLTEGAPVTLTCRAEGYDEDTTTILPTPGKVIAFHLLPRPKEHAQKTNHGKPAPTRSATQESTRETLPNPLREH
jgi:tRNA A-37 threonylcarbamoyl transferase component Bud32